MAVSIKSVRELQLMEEAGIILAKVHQELEDSLKEGMSTLEIDRLGEEIIRSYGCVPSFKNYEGYPASVCVSLNDEVVHGIPREDCILVNGDIVSLDIGVMYKGYHSDAARTHGIGEISKEAKDLIFHTRQSFFEGIKMAKDGNHLYDISNAIGDYLTSHGYGVVEDLVGHGIGTKLHEEPEVPNFRKKSRGLRLRSGMTLAIEPMVAAGSGEVEWLDDDWTVVTYDGSLAAHYENTVVITKDEVKILTLTQREIEAQIPQSLMR